MKATAVLTIIHQINDNIVSMFYQKTKILEYYFAFLSLGLWPFKGQIYFLTMIHQLTVKSNFPTSSNEKFE